MNYQGYLDPITHDKLIGWIWNPSKPSEHLRVEILLDGKLWTTRAAFRFRPDLERAGIGQGDHAFGIDLPPAIFDGQKHTFEVRAEGAEFSLGGSPMVFQSRYSGSIEGVDAHRIWGRMADQSRPGHPLTLEIWIDGVRRLQVQTNSASEFEAKLPVSVSPDSPVTIAVRVAGTSISPAGSPVERIPRLELLEGVRRMSGAARSSGELANHRQTLTRIFRALSEDSREYVLLSHSARSESRKISGAGKPVDIVVPVFKGIAQTLRCLESVLNSACEEKYELIAILDNPDDAAMRGALEGLQSRRPFTLLVNDRNLGFVATVNRGMRLHSDRDVLLLNSDTAVNGNWLDRLRAAAYSAPDAGTVTPLSNNATICSYPRFAVSNAIPAGYSVAKLDAICERANAGRTLDIPTAVGFCMYIRRDCLSETGFFDEVLFGRGYGEENDFCMRASSLGWRHLLAGGVFVEHEGRVSFGPGGEAESHANYQKLVARWPHYDAEVRQFLSRDPVKAVRRPVDLARAGRPGKPVACIASNLLGGGTERHAQEVAKSLAESGEDPIWMRFQDGSRVSLYLPGFPELANLVFDVPSEYNALVDALRALGVKRFHFHQIIGAHKVLFDLPRDLGIPYDCTLHDYAWICPQVNLIDDTRAYCGEPPLRACEECLVRVGLHKDWASFGTVAANVQELRGLSSRVLSGAARVITPSPDTASRYSRHIPSARFEPRPHDRIAPAVRVARAARAEPVRVVLIGSIGLSKGFDVLVACAKHARKHQLPLQFQVVGGTLDDRALEALGNVLVTGDYVESAVSELILAQKGHISFFPNVWPETFAYTLSLAFAHGLFPVAFSLGAIGERIREAKFGRLLALGEPPEAINKALLDEGRTPG